MRLKDKAGESEDAIHHCVGPSIFFSKAKGNVVMYHCSSLSILFYKVVSLLCGTTPDAALCI